MKRLATVLALMLVTAWMSGCGTIYGVAMDERDMSTIAADKTISTTISKRYYDDEDMKVLGISPYTFNGEVFLVGEYESAAQKSKSVSIAKGVEGVRSVTTYLLPKKDDPACGVSDSLKLVAKVKARLVADENIWSTNVEVKSVQCHIVLLGLVGSSKEKALAEEHARVVEGVRSVKSYLKVAQKTE